MEARHRQQDSNIASCGGTVTSVLARPLGGPVRTVEKTAALRERRQSDERNQDGGGLNDHDVASSSLGSSVTDDLDISDLASYRGTVVPAANTMHCSELTVSNIRNDDGGWAARTDVTFRHRADRLFYVDSAGRLHGPTDWRDRVRIAGIRRQEARRRQLQKQQQQQQQQHRQTRIVVQHRRQDSGLDTRLSDLERCLDQAMASIRRGRVFTSDGRSCAAGIGGGSNDSLVAVEDHRRRRRGNSEPPFEFACTQRTATFRPAEVYEEVEITTMRPIGRGIQDLGSASRFVFTSNPQLATTCRRTATIAASTSTPGAARRRLLLPTSPSSLRADQSYQQQQHQQHQQQRRRHQSAANVMEYSSHRYQRQQQQQRQAPTAFWGSSGAGNGNGGGGTFGGYWRR